MERCVVCKNQRLVRPGVCYWCCRQLGLNPNSDGLPANQGGALPPFDPAREERIRKYAARAAKKLPLFDEPLARAM